MTRNFGFLVLFCGLCTYFCMTSHQASALPFAHSLQPSTSQVTHRIADRHGLLGIGALKASMLGRTTTPETTSVTNSFQLGVLQQGQRVDNTLVITFWLVAVPLAIFDVVTSIGNISALFGGRHRFAWGVLGILSGGLSLVWGFIPLAGGSQSFILGGIPLWGLGAIALGLGLVNVFIRRRRRYRPYRRRRYYRRRWGVLPWLTQTQPGHTQAGLALFGEI